MPILGFDVDEIARLLALMEAGDVDEIEWEESGRYAKVAAPRLASPAPSSASAGPIPAAAPSARLAARPKAAPKAITAKAPTIGADEIALVSPMVGIFYRCGKPGDPPLIEVGQTIVRDQSIGIIEAMKIFSEIPAEAGGTVVSIPAQDGQLVQAGTPLVILKKTD